MFEPCRIGNLEIANRFVRSATWDATADSEGKVDLAIYARPHFMDDNTVAFIMRDRLSHKNLQSNPQAAYMFMEKGPGYKGMRMFLKKTGEETDPELIAGMTRRNLSAEEDKAKGPKFLVRFSVEKILPLIGSGDESA